MPNFELWHACRKWGTSLVIHTCSPNTYSSTTEFVFSNKCSSRLFKYCCNLRSESCKRLFVCFCSLTEELFTTKLYDSSPASWQLPSWKISCYRKSRNKNRVRWETNLACRPTLLSAVWSLKTRDSQPAYPKVRVTPTAFTNSSIV